MQGIVKSILHHIYLDALRAACFTSTLRHQNLLALMLHVLKYTMCLVSLQGIGGTFDISIKYVYPTLVQDFIYQQMTKGSHHLRVKMGKNQECNFISLLLTRFVPLE